MQPRILTLVDQPIFWPRAGISPLDPLRPFINSRTYTWSGFGSPGSAREAMAARATLEDRAVVKPGSYLTTITARSSVAPPNDFVFDLLDVGSGRKLSSEVLAYMEGTGGANGAKYSGRSLPFILPAPFLITDPGTLQIQITNLASSVNNICLFLTFAEPL